MKNNKDINIDKFIVSIDNMLASKYILIDRRIADILLAIADTHEVYNLIAECMVNFDFKYEWKQATATNVMKLPNTNEKRISFIFCLLNNLDDKNLDATQVLERYFSYDSSVSPYDLFCRNIIEEFKNLIMLKLNLKTEIEKSKETNNKNSQTMVVQDEFSALAKLLDDFGIVVLKQKKLKHCCFEQNDLIAVISTFKQVVLSAQTEYFYSYQVTINTAICKNKLLKAKFADANKLIDMIIRGNINEEKGDIKH